MCFLFWKHSHSIILTNVLCPNKLTFLKIGFLIIIGINNLNRTQSALMVVD